MPVDDHPVHPKTIRADGALWGCNTSHPNHPERKSGYWAPDGHSTAAVLGKGVASVAVKLRWVKDTSSVECRTGTRFDDPACEGCERCK